MPWEKLSNELRNQNWTILLILGSASFFLMSSIFTLGIILGGLIVIANFNVLQHSIRCAFSPDGALHAKKSSIIAKYYLRLLAMGVLICVIITQRLVDPVGLAIGLSIVVISIISLGIRAVWKRSSEETI